MPSLSVTQAELLRNMLPRPPPNERVILLRDLHRSKDPKCHDVLLDIKSQLYAENFDVDTFDQFLQCGLDDVLFDIAKDWSNYPTMDTSQTWDTNSYLITLYLSLSSIAQRLDELLRVDERKYGPRMDYYLENCDRLYTFIWREIFPAIKEGNPLNIQLLCRQILRFLAVSYTARHNGSPPSTCEIHHLNLHCWLSIDIQCTADVETTQACIQMLWPMVDELDRTKNVSAMKVFVDEAMRKQDCLREVVTKLSSSLRSETILDLLAIAYLSLLKGIISAAPEVLEWELPKHSILHDIMALCQRQNCRGDPSKTYHVVHYTSEIICDKMFDLMTRSGRGEHIRKELETHAEDLKILPITAKIMLETIRRKDYIPNLARLLRIPRFYCEYLSISREGNTTSQRIRSRLTLPRRRVILRLLREHWLPVLQTLRTIVPQMNRTRSTLGDHVESWLAWVEPILVPHPGELDTDGEADDSRRRWWKTDGCGRATCICTGTRPYHRMHLCTGCRLVLYCGPKCQQLDWNDHKAFCRRERSRCA